MSILYVVATPIGNLEDITFRAVRVLGEVELIAAEDTRVTRKLLSRYDIHTPLTSYNENNKGIKTQAIMETLQNHNVALVSDAGMPGINDPGHDLVREAYQNGHKVNTVPGPSAVTSAIAVSGIDFDQFIYLGFLPRKKVERRRLLSSVENERIALVAFETPHRLKSALVDILEVLGDRHLAVSRELTKIHEETFRGTVSESVVYFHEPRGEFTIVIQGSINGAPLEDESGVSDLMLTLRGKDLRTKEAVSIITEKTGMTRRRAYHLWLESQKQPLEDS